MNRRAFFSGALGVATIGAPQDPFFDGQSCTIDGRAHFLTEIIAPARFEPGGDFARAALYALLAQTRRLRPAQAEDRWGRVVGAVEIVVGARVTTLQEVLLAHGAARVYPQSDDFAFIERCYRAEGAGRAARLGLWSLAAYRARDAAKAEPGRGFQIYEGSIQSVAERGGRVFFNFGEDYRTDFTASATRGAFRRWRGAPAANIFAGARVEVRGYTDWLNGPSIDLRHEMQLRRAA